MLVLLAFFEHSTEAYIAHLLPGQLLFDFNPPNGPSSPTRNPRPNLPCRKLHRNRRLANPRRRLLPLRKLPWPTGLRRMTTLDTWARSGNAAGERSARRIATIMYYRRTGTIYMTHRGRTTMTSTGIVMKRSSRSASGRTACTLIE